MDSRHMMTVYVEAMTGRAFTLRLYTTPSGPKHSRPPGWYIVALDDFAVTLEGFRLDVSEPQEIATKRAYEHARGKGFRVERRGP